MGNTTTTDLGMLLTSKQAGLYSVVICHLVRDCIVNQSDLYITLEFFM